MEWLCVIGLLLVGCSMSLGQPINMVFMLMDDVSLTSRGEEGEGRRERGGGRGEEEGQGERESEGVRGKGGGRMVAERVVLH